MGTSIYVTGFGFCCAVFHRCGLGREQSTQEVCTRTESRRWSNVAHFLGLSSYNLFPPPLPQIPRNKNAHPRHYRLLFFERVLSPFARSESTSRLAYTVAELYRQKAKWPFSAQSRCPLGSVAPRCGAALSYGYRLLSAGRLHPIPGGLPPPRSPG